MSSEHGTVVGARNMTPSYWKLRDGTVDQALKGTSELPNPNPCSTQTRKLPKMASNLLRVPQVLSISASGAVQLLTVR